MAIIKCPSCGALVSDKASVCPKCGTSLLKSLVGAESNMRPAYRSVDDRKLKFNLRILICGLLSLVFLGTIVFFVVDHVRGSSLDENNELMIAGQVIDSAIVEKVLEKAGPAFYQIPDHEKVSEEARSLMTADLYESLSAAWDVPKWLDGEIGNEEFLWYFITGNDPSDEQQAKYAELISAKDGRYVVNIEYLEFWGNTPAENLSSITLVFVDEGGNILLDDFGDKTKDRCKKYVREEVKNYLSGKTNRYMKKNQQEEWYTDDHISVVNKSFREYLAKYKDYINRLK